MKHCKSVVLFIAVCGLILLAVTACADSKKYGKVNADSVRFRKEAESTESWAMLDKGWPVEILSEKTVGGVKYYRVCAGTPSHPDRQYWGYIQQKYVTRTSSKPSTPKTSSSSSSSSSGSSKTTAKSASGTVQTTSDKVNLRKSASSNAEVRNQVKKGTQLKYSAIVTQDGVKWYKVTYNGSTCYIMAKFCKEVSGSSSSSSSSSSSGSCKDAQKPSDPSTTAVTTKDKVILRASASSEGKQVAVISAKRTACTLKGDTKKADGYVWYKVKVNGNTGWVRGDLLRILSKAEAKTYKETGAKGTLYEPELVDWDDIKSIFYKGCVAKVTDVKTGISFKVRRWSGYLHADVEPYSASDTKAMCKIYGVSTAQAISDRNLYQRRSILVTIGSHSYAASMYGVPHNYPEGDTIDDNNYMGQFCIHFVNSKVHNSKKVDSDHQRAIQYAYNNGRSQLSKQGYTFK